MKLGPRAKQKQKQNTTPEQYRNGAGYFIWFNRKHKGGYDPYGLGKILALKETPSANEYVEIPDLLRKKPGAKAKL